MIRAAIIYLQKKSAIRPECSIATINIPVREPLENHHYTIWFSYQPHLCEWIDFDEVIAAETGSYLIMKYSLSDKTYIAFRWVNEIIIVFGHNIVSVFTCLI